MSEFALSMTSYQYNLLKSILYPGDGREAAAIMLCSRRAGDHRHRLIVRRVYPILDQWYRKRTASRVTWSTDALVPILDAAEAEDLSLIKVHSHPSGYSQFSSTDDIGDLRLLPGVRDWMERDVFHGSAVMLPNGRLFGRILQSDTRFTDIDLISVVGDDIRFWFADSSSANAEKSPDSRSQVFGRGTTDLVHGLTAAVIGCSGTGSPVIEQLVRLGIRRIILVDDDIVEDRNLTRMLHSTQAHAVAATSKVAALAEGIERIGLGVEVTIVRANLASRQAIKAVAEADVAFGCMDSIEGRYLLNRLATFYTLPYFDLGVRLIADGKSGVDEVCGTIHYLQPGRSSLISRGLFTMDDVAADGLKRQDPGAYQQQTQDGYIRGADVSRPAVISVNMLAASLAVNEFLARIHAYRDEPNSTFASIGFSLTSMEFYADPDGSPCPLLQSRVGCGDVEPPLGLTQFARGCIT